MAQLLVRNIPATVKERLKRRAERHGRSLEAEVREILDSAALAEPADTLGNQNNWVAELSATMARLGVTNEDVDALNENMEIARKNRSTFKLDDGIL
jgi:antitoxin FitA